MGHRIDSLVKFVAKAAKDVSVVVKFMKTPSGKLVDRGILSRDPKETRNMKLTQNVR